MNIYRIRMGQKPGPL